MKIVLYGINDNIHLWTYEKFKEIHNATVLDFNTNGNIIEYIIYEIGTSKINTIFLKENNLSYEIE